MAFVHNSLALLHKINYHYSGVGWASPRQITSEVKVNDFQDRKHEPLVLRVKQGSELDEFMRYMLEQDRPVGKTELVDAGLWVRSGHLPTWLSDWFDNVTMIADWGDSDKKKHLKFHHINPAAPISIGGDGSQIIGATQQAQPLERVQWPQSPPLVETMGDMYRKPGWFDVMRKMVKQGRHISLEGPPGVGKDTAVQELAAREGVPLVTVGGDAGFRRRDLVGSAQIAMGQSFMDVAEYAAAVVNGWWAVLSEVNAADADALLYINTQLAAPNIITIAGKAYPVHPDFRLFITYNAGLTGTKPLPQSFKDRFYPIKISFFNKVELKSVLTAHGMPHDTAWGTFIVEYGVDLWITHERGNLRYQVTSRRLMDAVALMNSGMIDNPKDALEAAVIGAIDNPMEAKVALQILNNLNDTWTRMGSWNEEDDNA